ncbi:hypothetical protein B0T20DRAFT_55801 [Sordaria brevicollis]|uniref:Uncharacterized protein n=1 Tax=Sordaria brevicollis TaxID=83679 RepID=A0AAE0P2T0_SORBR|nr:hypothetical protein B0T20DRAFT_55801 [Sordaria brevicollis]
MSQKSTMALRKMAPLTRQASVLFSLLALAGHLPLICAALANIVLVSNFTGIVYEEEYYATDAEWSLRHVFEDEPPLPEGVNIYLIGARSFEPLRDLICDWNLTTSSEPAPVDSCEHQPLGRSFRVGNLESYLNRSLYREAYFKVIWDDRNEDEAIVSMYSYVDIPVATRYGTWNFWGNEEVKKMAEKGSLTSQIRTNWFSATPLHPSSTPTQASPTSPPTIPLPQDQPDSDLPIAAIIAIGATVGSASVFLATLIVWLLRRRRKRMQVETPSQPMELDGTNTPTLSELEQPERKFPELEEPKQKVELYEGGIWNEKAELATNANAAELDVLPQRWDIDE